MPFFISGMYVPGIPGWQKFLLKLLLPVLKKYLITGLNLNAETGAEGLRKAKEFFKEVDGMLADGRKFLLGTEEPTFVDISFAAVSAIITRPKEMGGFGINEESRFKLEDFSAEWQKEAKAFRQTLAGKHALKMYADHRMPRTDYKV